MWFAALSLSFSLSINPSSTVLPHVLHYCKEICCSCYFSNVPYGPLLILSCLPLSVAPRERAVVWWLISGTTWGATVEKPPISYSLPAGTGQPQLGPPSSARGTPTDSYFSPNLWSVPTLLGLCHLMLLFKVSPWIVTWAARLAYLILLSVGSNLIYQIDSILFRWVIFHLPLVKLFPRFPRALYWARCYFVFICCHWVILFISME